MPQGKMKVKTNLPKSIKKKPNGRPATTRKNKPAVGKINNLNKIQKINKQITKNVNVALEQEIRQVANEGQKVFLSKKKTNSKASAPVTKTPGDKGLMIMEYRESGFSSFHVVENKVAATTSTTLPSKGRKLSDDRQVNFIGKRSNVMSPFVNHDRDIVTYNLPQEEDILSASNENLTETENVSRVNGNKMKEGVEVANTKCNRSAENKQNGELKETKTKPLKVTTKRIAGGSRNSLSRDKGLPKNEIKILHVTIKGKIRNTSLNKDGQISTLGQKQTVKPKGSTLIQIKDRNTVSKLKEKPTSKHAKSMSLPNKIHPKRRQRK